jgi:hypothetical protein
MAQRKITCITNVSNQTIPVMVSSILLADANASSEVTYDKEGSVSIPPGGNVDIETIRLEDAQIVQLKNMNLISTTVR